MESHGSTNEPREFCTGLPNFFHRRHGWNSRALEEIQHAWIKYLPVRVFFIDSYYCSLAFRVLCLIMPYATIGVARILSGVHFLPKKLTFLVVALKRLCKYTSNLSYPAKTVLKIDSCSGWGCTSCPGGALAHFSCKLGLKKFFSPPWWVSCTHCTPWLRLCMQLAMASLT